MFKNWSQDTSSICSYCKPKRQTPCRQPASSAPTGSTDQQGVRDAGRVEKKQGKEAELKRPLVKTIQQADKPAFPSKARGGKRLPRIEREKEQQGKGGAHVK